MSREKVAAAEARAESGRPWEGRPGPQTQVAASSISGLADYIFDEVDTILVAGSGVTLTSDTVAGSITIDAAGGGGGSDTLVIKDEGTTISGDCTLIDFVGAGVTASTISGGVQVSIPGGGGSGLSDGDYGDISVSGSGTVLTIDSNAVTFAKMQAIGTNVLLGNDSAGSAVQEVTVGGGLTVAGGTLKPKFRGALVWRSTTQSFSAVTYGVMSWDTAEYDTDSIWSAGSPTRLTVPSGVTRVRLVANFEYGSTSDVLVEFRKNQTTAGAATRYPGLATIANYATYNTYVNLASPVLNVTAGDWFDLGVNCRNASSAQTKSTWMAMEIIEA